jgi:hypothetical protein
MQRNRYLPENRDETIAEASTEESINECYIKMEKFMNELDRVCETLGFITNKTSHGNPDNINNTKLRDMALRELLPPLHQKVFDLRGIYADQQEPNPSDKNINISAQKYLDSTQARLDDDEVINAKSKKLIAIYDAAITHFEKLMDRLKPLDDAIENGEQPDYHAADLDFIRGSDPIIDSLRAELISLHYQPETNDAEMDNKREREFSDNDDDDNSPKRHRPESPSSHTSPTFQNTLADPAEIKKAESPEH